MCPCCTACTVEILTCMFLMGSEENSKAIVFKNNGDKLNFIKKPNKFQYGVLKQ